MLSLYQLIDRIGYAGNLTIQANEFVPLVVGILNEFGEHSGQLIAGIKKLLILFISQTDISTQSINTLHKLIIFRSLCRGVKHLGVFVAFGFKFLCRLFKELFTLTKNRISNKGNSAQQDSNNDSSYGSTNSRTNGGSNFSQSSTSGTTYERLRKSLNQSRSNNHTQRHADDFSTFAEKATNHGTGFGTTKGGPQTHNSRSRRTTGTRHAALLIPVLDIGFHPGIDLLVLLTPSLSQSGIGLVKLLLSQFTYLALLDLLQNLPGGVLLSSGEIILGILGHLLLTSEVFNGIGGRVELLSELESGILQGLEELQALLGVLTVDEHILESAQLS